MFGLVNTLLLFRIDELMQACLELAHRIPNWNPARSKVHCCQVPERFACRFSKKIWPNPKKSAFFENFYF
jgi:hypothetical protein